MPPQYKKIDISNFDWNNKIDEVSYLQTDKELKIRASSGLLVKYVIIPDLVYKNILEKFQNDEATLAYIVDYSIKTIFKDLLENTCSWNSGDNFINETDDILKNVKNKVLELDFIFRQFE